MEIKIVKGDITELEVGAIVHAANSQLTMEEGLAGSIHQKGGGAIEEEAFSKRPVEEGDAIVTKAGKLKAQYIIHAVMTGVNTNANQETIRHAVASALRRVRELKIRSIAFPALGHKAGDFPLVGYAKIIIQEILKFSRNAETSLEEIIFCLYDAETFEVFDKTIRGYISHIQENLGPGPYMTVDIIIERKEGIILIERSNPPYGWALPGGFVDYGESLEKAATREAKEETNLDLIDLRQFHTYSDPGRDPRFHTISTVFIAEGHGNPRFGDDARGLKVARYENLPELDYAFDHKRIIKEYLVEKDFD